MSIAERVEMQKLAERVAELEKHLEILVESIAIKNGLLPANHQPNTLRLRDKKRG